MNISPSPSTSSTPVMTVRPPPSGPTEARNSAPAPANTSVQTELPIMAHRRKRRNGIPTVPARIGTMACTTETNREPTIAIPPSPARRPQPGQRRSPGTGAAPPPAVQRPAECASRSSACRQ
ncbi:hypothetical protein HDA32_003760 [Spinactinospora alkalitolerans]|uniref:Uncharacterized protein n=1 Tax=Spinactinospora alkalitolerans TaxID=687207 RepID=A0A852U3V8_9ACTN|nr:hypothetical protein [Spinactinospora alkalitolerans]NYE48640.1 hypothetical protein [Spinactinospora alkalitolerans]